MCVTRQDWIEISAKNLSVITLAFCLRKLPSSALRLSLAAGSIGRGELPTDGLAMNAFDTDIVLFLNSFARRSWTFDWLVSILDSNYIVKGGVMGALLLTVWFAETGDAEIMSRRRASLVSGLFATCLAVLVARLISFAFPFRGRLIYEPGIHFVRPFSMDGQEMIGWWTSFPSDNAVLFFALAASVYAACRRAGVLAYLHAFITVAFARVYVGIHHPTDILAGALIGIGIVQLSQIPAVRAWMTCVPMDWLSKRPQVFYPLLFILLLAITTVFDPVFSLGHVVRTIASSRPALN
jgi:undecaprenyl-diphosphatase